MKKEELLQIKRNKLDIRIPKVLHFAYGTIKKIGLEKYGMTPLKWIDTVGSEEAIGESLKATMRHLVEIEKGDEVDSESSELHLWHAWYTLGMAIEAVEYFKKK